MKYIECPETYDETSSQNDLHDASQLSSLFMAGGISGCSDWQEKFIQLLADEDLVVFNPRRRIFDTDDKSLTGEQIAWEYDYLKKADATSFWFTSETLCPITLFELGKQSTLNRPLFVGVHPDYARKEDVEIQMRLLRPDVKIVYDLKSLADQVKKWIRKKHKNS